MYTKDKLDEADSVADYPIRIYFVFNLNKSHATVSILTQRKI